MVQDAWMTIVQTATQFARSQLFDRSISIYLTGNFTAKNFTLPKLCFLKPIGQIN
jgi:hypothetical protein